MYLENKMWHVPLYIPAGNKVQVPCIPSVVEIISYPVNLAPPRIALWAQASQGLRLTSTLYSTEWNPKIPGGMEGTSLELAWMSRCLWTTWTVNFRKSYTNLHHLRVWLSSVLKIYHQGWGYITGSCYRLGNHTSRLFKSRFRDTVHLLSDVSARLTKAFL